MKYKMNFILPLVVVVLICLGYTAFIQISTPRIAYVDINQLYAGFEMKKELEEKLISVKNERQKILDSLKMNLNISARKLTQLGLNPRDTADNRVKKMFNKGELLYKKEEAFSSLNEQITQQYNDQILSQLSLYVIDYGKVNGYHFIFGLTDNGNIMYAKESENISKEVLDYINSRYMGFE